MLQLRRKTEDFYPPKQPAAGVCCKIFVILPSSANITYCLSSKLCSLTPPHKIFVHNISPKQLTVTEEIQHTVHNVVRWPCELSYCFVSLSHSNSHSLQQGWNTQMTEIWGFTAQQWIAWILSHPMLLKSTTWGRKYAIQPARWFAEVYVIMNNESET
jgi:hypothetical protein